MTIWIPDLSSYDGPKYLAIAQALEDDVRAGKLPPGARMPTHRELAFRLGVTVGTVTRAYGEAQRHNLIGGEVGRGTYVLEMQRPLSVYDVRSPEPSGVINLSMNRPAIGPEGDMLADTLRDIADSPNIKYLTEYQPANGMPHHRDAAAALLARLGFAVHGAAVILTNGAQHSMAGAAIALLGRGDVLLTERLTYPGLVGLAHSLGIKLLGVEIDAEGLIPDAFDAACRTSRAKAVYTLPTHHNPTTATMSRQRREDIIAVARRHGVIIIEDDVYGFQPSETPPPLAVIAPDQVCYVTSATKSIAPGLRVGVMVPPKKHKHAIGLGIQATGWMIPPLMGEVLTRWIQSGIAADLIHWHGEDARKRVVIAHDLLGGFDLTTQPEAMHVWLTLPDGLRPDAVVSAAIDRGVSVTPPGPFMAGKGPLPNAIRLCLGAAGPIERMVEGLHIVRDAIENPSAINFAMM
ncbi:aminotransferase-like domain-containing protein [Varunaivibrio sulfuroxidans]|uniref:DNA-binding transcriptional MocR family regulator n=1 Tax=Varunaivibrio sulfuroxidans TaxID=1773489 RepID=A0A4R3JEQ9_9PROT|nr:PLP-dependent aminotransferase family protein [Varunaivibrio sulfuroxidans]TCS63160.1 DNA-binding transcriptional MocR family regulator [Varunaivibrio sulfuroxidans]WES31778.1 PLP-dependent aminotransferase family protein [Varunaivibrio sulfuroxidans]